MNTFRPIQIDAAHDGSRARRDVRCGSSGQTGEAGASNLPTLVTADARKVSPRQFLDALGLSSPEKREADRAIMQEDCIRAIRRGDTYGWPGIMVDQCRAIIAQREIDEAMSLAPVVRLSATRIGA